MPKYRFSVLDKCNTVFYTTEHRGRAMRELAKCKETDPSDIYLIRLDGTWCIKESR